MESRVARLERSNRRWRWCAAAMLGVVGLGSMAALQPLETGVMPYRPSRDRGIDPGFAISYPGSEADVSRQQVGMLAEADAAQSQLIVELSAAVKECERRISALERVAAPEKTQRNESENQPKGQKERP